MKYCPKCGNPMGDEFKFCPKCGATSHFSGTGSQAGDPVGLGTGSTTQNKGKGKIVAIISVIAAVVALVCVALILVIKSSDGGGSDSQDQMTENMGGAPSHVAPQGSTNSEQESTTTPTATPEPTPKPQADYKKDKDYKNGMIELKAGKEYSKYDINGDGTPDKIKVTADFDHRTEYDTMRVWINGEKAFDDTNFIAGPHVFLMFMEEGQVLLSISHPGEDNAGIKRIYRCEGSDLHEVLDMTSPGDTNAYGWTDGSVDFVSYNTVSISFFHQSPMVGTSNYTMEFEYSDGKLEPTEPADLYISKWDSDSAGFIMHQTMTARVDLDVYDQNGEGGEVVFTIHPKDEVQFLKILYVNGRPWYYVSLDGKEGWLPCGTEKEYSPSGKEKKYGSNYYFRDVGYAA